MKFNNIEQTCKLVLTGELSPQKALGDYGDEEKFLRDANNLEIEISPNIIISILEKFLKKEKSVDELKEWSLFILLTGAFVTPNWQYDDSLEFDNMWDILGQLSTPEIDGEVNREVAEDYIKQLKLLQKDS